MAEFRIVRLSTIRLMSENGLTVAGWMRSARAYLFCSTILDSHMCPPPSSTSLEQCENRNPPLMHRRLPSLNRGRCNAGQRKIHWKLVVQEFLRSPSHNITWFFILCMIFLLGSLVLRTHSVILTFFVSEQATTACVFLHSGIGFRF